MKAPSSFAAYGHVSGIGFAQQKTIDPGAIPRSNSRFTVSGPGAESAMRTSARVMQAVLRASLCLHSKASRRIAVAVAQDAGRVGDDGHEIAPIGEGEGKTLEEQGLGSSALPGREILGKGPGQVR